MSDALDVLFAALPETLTVKEVAPILRKSRQGIYDMLKRGVLPGYEIEGKWLIVRDELKAYIRRGSNEPAGTERER